ncbi:MAG: anaerobic ribonucleoside-triphosphate reductase activating protein [Anaerolineae bacterium]|nr:anaerobic ribonucleoside-triphosphate reductase activating protein [Anaerolineae bacterium]
MHIKGWVKSTLLDYPSQVATSLFCGGCNLHCPSCHNRDLVLSPYDLPDIPEAEVLAFLEKRRGLLDGVVISGGEPTLQPDLPEFCRQVREMGYLVKLDTNGYRPDVLGRLLDDRLLDYVAMDLKAPPIRYDLLAGIEVDMRLIQRSVDLLKGGEIDYEFRTTVVPGLLAAEDIESIVRWVSGARRYFLQQFVPHNTLDLSLGELSPYLPDQLEAMAASARAHIAQVAVRGI